MPTSVIMPALGVAQQTGTLLKWLKSEGDAVSKGEPLMEIETDKATVEIEAPASGILANVSASPGDQVPVGNRIAIILAPGEKAGGSPESPPPPAQRGGEKSLPTAFSQPPSRGEDKGEGSLRATQTELKLPGRSVSKRILASPAAKRVAREEGIDLATVTGSGPEGSILTRDVLRKAKVTAVPAPALDETIRPLNSIRRIIAERMARSKQTAPHFYLSVDIDMGGVIRHRAEWNGSGAARKPSHNDFIIHACARALKEFPSLNASFTEQGIQFHAEVNIGMAVALDEGLLVPVLRNADRLTLSQLAEHSRSLIDKARSRKLLPLDYEGGTFTVSNLGMLGVDNFVAIINPPQAAILAIGRIAERVVADKGMFAIRSTMTVTLSADHRVVDGALGARFLQRIKQSLETVGLETTTGG